MSSSGFFPSGHTSRHSPCLECSSLLLLDVTCSRNPFLMLLWVKLLYLSYHGVIAFSWHLSPGHRWVFTALWSTLCSSQEYNSLFSSFDSLQLNRVCVRVCVLVAQSCPTLCNLMDGIIVEVTQSCLTLCDPMDCIIHGILQARILEWIAFPFSRGSSQPRDRTQVSSRKRIHHQISTGVSDS